MIELQLYFNRMEFEGRVNPYLKYTPESKLDSDKRLMLITEDATKAIFRVVKPQWLPVDRKMNSMTDSCIPIYIHGLLINGGRTGIWLMNDRYNSSIVLPGGGIIKDDKDIVDGSYDSFAGIIYNSMYYIINRTDSNTSTLYTYIDQISFLLAKEQFNFSYTPGENRMYYYYNEDGFHIFLPLEVEENAFAYSNFTYFSSLENHQISRCANLDDLQDKMNFAANKDVRIHEPESKLMTPIFNTDWIFG